MYNRGLLEAIGIKDKKPGYCQLGGPPDRPHQGAHVTGGPINVTGNFIDASYSASCRSCRAIRRPNGRDAPSGGACRSFGILLGARARRLGSGGLPTLGLISLMLQRAVVKEGGIGVSVEEGGDSEKGGSGVGIEWSSEQKRIERGALPPGRKAHLMMVDPAARAAV
ncbi:hypothetical protein B0H17DRAFT_1151045 [Mycena rosella]|uniref:Uncharacterized protein n=1 Tax=Mycena rosella TaxID=1033263 RepID=A0AAD7BNW8_MYCRO|nr:hypothetical protein B0H17DRAFT_1151045 [Mycena rosella]